MRIYTRTGDSGQTGLIGGKRVQKDHLRVEAYGSVDELNAHLGIIQALLQPSKNFSNIQEIVVTIQKDLFDMGAELANPKPKTQRIEANHIANLEKLIDTHESKLSSLKHFILPGGSYLGASLHAARTVCRRAERRTMTLSRKGKVNPEIIRYLNRLSDLLFVLARYVNQQSRQPEIEWKK